MIVSWDDAIQIRERLHAEGNRFGMMMRHHEEEAQVTLGNRRREHKALAEKWKLAQHLCYAHASEVSSRAGIPEYGEAWNHRLQPQDLERV